MSDNNWKPNPVGTDTDPGEGLGPLSERDAEGHRMGPGEQAFPNQPGPGERLGPGEQLLRGDGTPADYLDDRDTEGHLDLRRRPAGGGELSDGSTDLLRGDGTPADFIRGDGTPGD